MESLKDILMRVDHLSPEEAELRIEKNKFLLESGVSPLVVLIAEYGDSIEHLEEVLTPRSKAS